MKQIVDHIIAAHTSVEQVLKQIKREYSVLYFSIMQYIIQLQSCGHIKNVSRKLEDAFWELKKVISE